MRFCLRRRPSLLAALGALVGICCALFLFPPNVPQTETAPAGAAAEGERDYIKWVDFNVPYDMLEAALRYDLDTYDTAQHAGMAELLALTAARTGGNWDSSAKKQFAKYTEQLKNGATVSSLSEGLKYYDYYREAYGAVLDGFVGEYEIEAPDGDGGVKAVTKYGLRVFSPIASGFGFGHYDDFGTARSYGYRRRHLGNDLLCAIGTPVVAVEGGTVEALGWNQYGGWRIGIRSHDGRRYYYYAHLRKDHPYVQTLAEGDIVEAGDVIGYVGMTGYSRTENVNNIKIPHLHFGLQLIFDESQKDGNGEIWVDVYSLVELLQKNRMPVDKNTDTGDYVRRYRFLYNPEPQ